MKDETTEAVIQFYDRDDNMRISLTRLRDTNTVNGEKKMKIKLNRNFSSVDWHWGTTQAGGAYYTDKGKAVIQSYLLL